MPVDNYGIPDDFNVLIYTAPDFPGGSDGKEFACNAEDADLISGLGRSPREGNATHFSNLAGKSHRQRSLVSYSPWGQRVRHN